MIKLRSKNLVDYERMRMIALNSDISYIDNGWLVGRGANYGTTIVNLSAYTFAQGETYYIVADVECLYAGKVRNFSAIQLCLWGHSNIGSIIIGKNLTQMAVGDKQRVAYKCYVPDEVKRQYSTILIYNSYNSANLDNTGDSFKITNLCFFKEDYTIDYVPYWYEPTKIMTRTRNLFAPTYSHASLVKEDNGFIFTDSGAQIINHSDCLKMFKPNKTYTLNFDLEFVEVPQYTYVTQALGFNLYDSVTKKTLASFTKYVQPSQIAVGNKIHMSSTRTMPADLLNAVLLAYSGYCRNADENNKLYYVTTRFSNIMLTEGTEEVEYVPYMSEVKTVAWGVKPECKIVLDGSENIGTWTDGSNSIGFSYSDNNFISDYPAIYNDVFGGFYASGIRGKIFIRKLSGISALYSTWYIGSPPYPSWETKDANGKAIANIPQIKADLAKKPLIVYYDNTNSKPKALAELLKIVRREVYNNFSATIDSNILTLTNSSVENNVLILPDDKTVTNNVLTL